MKLAKSNGVVSAQQKLLEKMQSQGKSWIIFFGVSAICIILVAIFVYFLVMEPSPDLVQFAVGGIGVTGCLWLTWTMRFAMTTMNNQKIIYQLLAEINHDIDAIRRDLHTAKSKLPNNSS